MAQPNVKLLCWNVRGLNAPARRDAVRDLLRDYHATIVCLQETKLDHVDDTLIATMLGPSFTANYHVLPAVGSRGGMIMAVSDAYFRLNDFHATLGSISATVTMLADGLDWTLSYVYGPQGEQDKLLFINELRGLKHVVKPRWLILGDFNLITKAADKNNQNINNRLIGSFRSALNHLELKEMRLSGRKFTWSNAQENPVLTKIDHFFHSDDWDELFPNAHLQAISSACSDHAPLLLLGDTEVRRCPSFKFEEFCLRLPGFKEAVAMAWNKPVQSTNAI